VRTSAVWEGQQQQTAGEQQGKDLQKLNCSNIWGWMGITHAERAG